MYLVSLVILIVTLVFPSQSAKSITVTNANIYYVCNGTGCGILTTHSTITDALAVASPGDSIYVAKGTYTESITVNESITLQGGWRRDFAKYNPALYTTTIQGSGSQSVISIEDGASPLIQGFTITGGGGSVGAGISIMYSGGTIKENRIM
jgi:pectin methylesterase-like acyl-CoA thioesterase